MTLPLFVSLLPWVLVAAGCWLAWQLARQHGRILLRLEALEKQLSRPTLEGVVAPVPAGLPGGKLVPEFRTGNKGNRPLEDSRLNRSGLPPGTPAPSFRLPGLDGGELALEEYRGRPALLVFSDARCGPCDQLAPRLEQARRERPELQILMVSRGDADATRRKVAQFGLTFPVGLQRQWEISKLYGMFATPIAYLIDAEGIIAADVAVGVEPILGLLGVAVPTRPVGKAPAQLGEMAVGA